MDERVIRSQRGRPSCLPLRIFQLFPGFGVVVVGEKAKVERPEWDSTHLARDARFLRRVSRLDPLLRGDWGPLDGRTAFRFPAYPMLVAREHRVHHAIVKFALRALLEVACHLRLGVHCPSRLNQSISPIQSVSRQGATNIFIAQCVLILHRLILQVQFRQFGLFFRRQRQKKINDD